MKLASFNDQLFSVVFVFDRNLSVTRCYLAYYYFYFYFKSDILFGSDLQKIGTQFPRVLLINSPSPVNQSL